MYQCICIMTSCLYLSKSIVVQELLYNNVCWNQCIYKCTGFKWTFRFQATNGKCNIWNIFTLPYKVGKVFSCMVLILYMCTLKQSRNTITAFYYKNNSIYCNVLLSQVDISNSIKLTLVKMNIRWSFKGCRRTFKGYKLTFVLL